MFDSENDRDFAVLVQHCENKNQKKIVRSSKLFVLDTKKPFNRAWRFMPESTNDYKKDVEYGYHEGKDMVKYYIILMSETYDKLKQDKSKGRLQFPAKRRSVGPASVPFKQYKIQSSDAPVNGEKQDSKAEKASMVKKDRRMVLLAQSDKLREKLQKRLHDDSAPEGDEADPGATEAKQHKDSEDNDGWVNCQAQHKTVDFESDGGRDDQIADSVVTIPCSQPLMKSPPLQIKSGDSSGMPGKPTSKSNSDSSSSSESEESDVEDQDLSLDMCKGCHEKNTTKIAAIKKAFQRTTTSLAQKYDEVKEERDSLRAQLEVQLKRLDEINAKITQLPGEMRKSAYQCWVSSLPKFIVPLEDEFTTVEVPDGYLYVGEGVTVAAAKLELCSDPLTVRGRVDELCDLFWGDQCAFYSPSGKREKYGKLIRVKPVPETHTKAMRIILNAMEWDDDISKKKNTISKLKECVRKQTSLKCLEYVQEHFPREYLEIVKEEQDKMKAKPSKKKIAENHESPMKKKGKTSPAGNHDLNKSFTEDEY